MVTTLVLETRDLRPRVTTLSGGISTSLKTKKRLGRCLVESVMMYGSEFFFFPVPVCAITAPGVPGGTVVSMNHFSTLCG
jgi:hypothetical protein